VNATPRLSMKIIDDPGAIASLRAPWSALDARPGVHPFQQFGWASTWLDSIGVGGGWRPLVATAWDDDRLVALLPLCVRRYKGVRILEWIGARVSDYCDALVAADVDARAVLAALWKALERHGGFDVARFNHVRDDAHVSPVLSALSPWTETREHAGGVPITWASGEEWLRAQSAGMRDRVKYNGRRMVKAGYDVQVCGTADECAAIVDTLVAQKRPWLAARGLSSMINEPGGVEFLKGVVAAAAARGELHLSTVRNHERIAACDLAFVRNGNVYSYIASFDPELAKYSFGRVLTDRLLMWACDTGQRRLDLLLGAYDYKTEYNCTLEPVRTEVVARGLLGAAAVMVYRRQSASRAQ
jgi:CelD/BcsL family acetyltransferase involved in cellulose biosynthesis